MCGLWLQLLGLQFQSVVDGVFRGLRNLTQFHRHLQFWSSCASYNFLGFLNTTKVGYISHVSFNVVSSFIPASQYLKIKTFANYINKNEIQTLNLCQV